MIKYLCTIALAATTLAGCSGETGGNASSPAASPVAAVQPPAGQSWATTVVKTPEGGFRMGNPDAPIKLVEYGSRLCPTCGAFGQAAMKPIENTYVASGKVSYEFREFMVHGAPDFAPALLGRCGGTAPFFPILEQMLVAQPTILPKMESAGEFQASLQGQPPAQVFTAWAERLGYLDFVKQRGIPEAKARACLTDMTQIEALSTMTEKAGTDMKVTGTPTFFLNGKMLEGQVSWPQVEQSLKTAGA
ncbi:MAG TPA: thioredoxin domain-containing protein [Sphingomonas sp.]|nr:thioredoxin domain-containing protein [Sphingomonas sp.]